MLGAVLNLINWNVNYYRTMVAIISPGMMLNLVIDQTVSSTSCWMTLIACMMKMSCFAGEHMAWAWVKKLMQFCRMWKSWNARLDWRRGSCGSGRSNVELWRSCCVVYLLCPWCIGGQCMWQGHDKAVIVASCWACVAMCCMYFG